MILPHKLSTDISYHVASAACRRCLTTAANYIIVPTRERGGMAAAGPTRTPRPPTPVAAFWGSAVASAHSRLQRNAQGAAAPSGRCSTRRSCSCAGTRGAPVCHARQEAADAKVRATGAHNVTTDWNQQVASPLRQGWPYSVPTAGRYWGHPSRASAQRAEARPELRHHDNIAQRLVLVPESASSMSLAPCIIGPEIRAPGHRGRLP
jgi:hypothetical protein